MNTLRKLLTLALITGPCCSMSAKNVTSPDVIGTILDEQGQPMPFANVILLSPNDSSFIMGTTSDETGKFIIRTEETAGILKVSVVGYNTLYTNITLDKHNNTTIRLQPQNTELGAVTVTTSKPITKLTARGIQTEIAGTVLENIGSANDLLARIPGLMKGKDGITVIGKGEPLYYINGRKVRDISELQRLRSNEIQSVEVITNPGAQYDSKVNAVVRIKTIQRQGEGFGFNAGIQDAQSLKIKDNNDQTDWLNMNYRWNNIDVFTGINYNEFTMRQQSNIFQKTLGSPSFMQDGTLQYNQGNKDLTYNFGANWQINDKHSIGFKFERTNEVDREINQYLIDNLYRNDMFIDSVYAVGHHKPIDNAGRTSTNAYYSGSVGKLGIDLNVDYFLNKSSQLSTTDEQSTLDGLSTIGNTSHTDNKLWAAKLVLSYPIWKGQLQFGTEQTYSRKNDDYAIGSTNTSQYDTSRDIPSTISSVNEDNIASFAEYAFALPEIGQFSFGLRYEHVKYVYDSDLDMHNGITTIHDNIESVHDDFFPSAAWATAIPTKSGAPVQLSASYSMKTIRPNFYDLNSAVQYHSRYVLQSGNAFLQNETDHNASINARYKFFTLGTNYTRQINAISRWSSLYNEGQGKEEQGVVLVKACNLSEPVQNLTAYVAVSPTIGCWNINYVVGLSQNWFDIDVKDPIDQDKMRSLSFSNKPQIIANIYNTWRLGADKDGKGAWQLELNGQFMSKGYNKNTEFTNNYFELSAAVQKSFLKNDALCVRLDLSDILKTADYNIATDCGSHIIRQTNTFDYHRVKMSVTYNFNTARSKYKGTGAGKDTQQRMKKQ